MKQTPPSILIGVKEISQYLRVSRCTLYRWSTSLDLPLMRRPDGRLMTSTTLLDSWMYGCGQMQQRLRRERQSEISRQREEEEFAYFIERQPGEDGDARLKRGRRGIGTSSPKLRRGQDSDTAPAPP